jgi:hypothetical protein
MDGKWQKINVQSTVFKWHHKFKNGYELIEDNPTHQTACNIIRQVQELVVFSAGRALCTTEYSCGCYNHQGGAHLCVRGN